MAIVIIRPLSGLDFNDILPITDQNWIHADGCIAEGKKVASDAMERDIKASCEAYIWDKAKALDADIRTEFFLNEEMIPVSVEIRGEPDPDMQEQLQEILMMDIGIPKENQQWIWNQENSS